MSTYQLHIPVRSYGERNLSPFARLFSIMLLIVVGMIIGLILAAYVAVRWVQVDTPPIYEQTQVQGDIIP